MLEMLNSHHYSGSGATTGMDSERGGARGVSTLVVIQMGLLSQQRCMNMKEYSLCQKELLQSSASY